MSSLSLIVCKYQLYDYQQGYCRRNSRINWGLDQKTFHGPSNLKILKECDTFFKINFYWSIVALQRCIISTVQQNESTIHIPISPLFWISFSFRSPKSVILFFFLTSLLEYNCFTMLCWFLFYNKVNQLYIYIYPHISSLLHLPPTLPIPPL